MLERWVRRTGRTQGELAREVLCKGLPVVVEGYRKRQRRQEDGGVRVAVRSCSPFVCTPLVAGALPVGARGVSRRPDGGKRCGRYLVLMSLFAVQQADDDNAALVIEAAVAVAADGWWVFLTVDDRPIATLPTEVVRAIDALPAGDARGRAWAQDGNAAAAVTENRLYAKVS